MYNALKSLTTTSFVRLSDGRLFALWIEYGAADCHFSNYGGVSESIIVSSYIQPDICL
jgi:hypothetical protein